MTVRRLLGELDSRELTEWMAYERVEPFGVVRDNLHAGVVAATVANANRSKSAKPFQPTDFLLEFGKRRDGPTAETMMAQMGMIAAAQNVAVGADEIRGAAAPGHNPEPDDEPERLRRAGGDVEHGGDGVGGDAAVDPGNP